ncbi:MAG TPA: Trp family transcriptional regulator [Deltaproteobacteria bacterium]|nr:Trp family transcriptional regulator [Deltaproteobacteria bacterium]
MAKRRPFDDPEHEIEKVFARITDYQDMISFFEEIFTPREISDLVLRWQLLKELHGGNTQRSIAEKHRISLCKITRGSRVLKRQNSFTKKVLDSLIEKKD